MKLLKELTEAKKQYAIYFDATGAGRGPEVVAGPFDSEIEAEEYADEHDIMDDEDRRNMWVDEYDPEYEK